MFGIQGHESNCHIESQIHPQNGSDLYATTHPMAVLNARPSNITASVTFVPDVVHHDEGNDNILDSNKKRKAKWQYVPGILKELISAHIQHRDPIIHIPTNFPSIVLGLKSAWHLRVHLLVRCSLDHSIRFYKGRRALWIKCVCHVYSKIDTVFTYDYPLSKKYLSKFMRSVIKGDRKTWKSRFCSTHGEQHHKCPDEAFVVLQKY